MDLLWRAARDLGVVGIDIELRSPLSLDECCSRLRDAISPDSLFANGPVLGDITGSRLRARKHIVRRGAFQAYLAAHLMDDAGCTLIKCRFTMRWWDFCFLAFWMLLVVLQWRLHSADRPAVLPVLMIVGGIVVFCRMRYLAHEERRFLIEFLRNTVGAREVQEGRRPPAGPVRSSQKRS
jgi:hypothetical protein